MPCRPPLLLCWRCWWRSDCFEGQQTVLVGPLFEFLHQVFDASTELTTGHRVVVRQSLQAVSFEQMALKQFAVVLLQALQGLQQLDPLRIFGLATALESVVVG